MNYKEYKYFKYAVENANQYSDIWYAVNAWFNLTQRQADDIRTLLRVHPSIIKEKWKLIMPSGFYMRPYDGGGVTK